MRSARGRGTRAGTVAAAASDSERPSRADRREDGCCASERSERGTTTRLATHLAREHSCRRLRCHSPGPRAWTFHPELFPFSWSVGLDRRKPAMLEPPARTTRVRAIQVRGRDPSSAASRSRLRHRQARCRRGGKEALGRPGTGPSQRLGAETDARTVPRPTSSILRPGPFLPEPRPGRSRLARPPAEGPSSEFWGSRDRSAHSGAVSRVLLGVSVAKSHCTKLWEGKNCAGSVPAACRLVAVAAAGRPLGCGRKESRRRWRGPP
jgi:hypothetical protein